ncbi:exodeoxyribonuclease VII large subunit [Acetilactobacillus jinshanensis]|uniref:Exodeoxyribonuclease 7 large subunit n=1 Tax=Acetilactobacillus jinshanensis TaxID=1720083 RepID=A0A4P6ZMB3_9LACO|nr:exodeoxyribonuclease VII large subunit [Acetilactobacillus jinshanensis]URL61927.1 exodeoxyribonuclease VII large subunit [uncultured bacterium]
MTNHKYLTVTALSQYIKRKFDYDPYLGRVYLMGEISNYRYRPNAHQYFSLKDDHAKISAVMFRSEFSHVKFRPEEGMKVLVTGRISVYEPQGSYQIYVDHMEPQGVGELYEAYEQLKKKLSKEGLFNPAHKKPLPHFPKRIAVITSRSGAVIRDIIVTTRRRYPIVQIVLFPAIVQGNNAADNLVKQIHRVDQDSHFDTLIIGRGGGSIEDLWPFNEESVVRAIYNCRVPVISSVGHETDTTLADLVADVRAATPTAAAELATPVLTDEITNIVNLRERIITAFRDKLALLQQRLTKIQQSYVFRQPKRLYETYIQQVDNLKANLRNVVQQYLTKYQRRLQSDVYQLNYHSPKQKIVNYRQQIQLATQQLKTAMQTIVNNKKAVFQNAVSSLDHLSPLKTMSRGYSLVTRQNHLIKGIKDLKPKDSVTLNFRDGTANAVVNRVQPNKKGK